jgi:hypothetical protein
MNRNSIFLFLYLSMYLSCGFNKKIDFYIGFYGGFKNYDTRLTLNSNKIYHNMLETNFSIISVCPFSQVKSTGINRFSSLHGQKRAR